MVRTLLPRVPACWADNGGCVCATGVRNALLLMQALLGAPPTFGAVKSAIDAAMLPVLEGMLRSSSEDVSKAAATCIGCIATISDYRWVVSKQDNPGAPPLRRSVKQAMQTAYATATSMHALAS